VSYQRWLIHKTNGIVTLTLNRPEVRNALDNLSWQELGAIVSDISKDAQIKVVIITGAGQESFAAGADVEWLLNRPTIESWDPGVQGVLNSLENLPQPTIAAINGYAFGGGCELVLACDLRIASQNARFGLTEIGVGIIPGGGGTQRLPRLIGAGRAKEMIFLGKLVDASEAECIGLVNRVCPLTELISVANELAHKLLNRAPLAVRMAKQAINYGLQTDLITGMAYEKACQSFLYTTEDQREGMIAFLEKRKPIYIGR